MTEALYNAAGLGLPIVMTVANRAIRAPINIWTTTRIRCRSATPGGSSCTLRQAEHLVIRRCPQDRPAATGRGSAPVDFRRGVQGLDESTALFEGRRCMSCGSCFACDNCYGVCSDNAVIKLDPHGLLRYEVDSDFCKGCGLCAQECPCGAIEMVPETI
jgi:Pyruvate/2-oxoacid:ferredoxin oxidoreductase delta subunit